MTLSRKFSRHNGKSWQDKVLDADVIWAQIKAMLAVKGAPMPATPRRPDVRMMLDNISGATVRFQNPGDHSGSKEEVIPATGDKKAVMVMVKGDTLEAQYQNAQTLYDTYNLGAEGLSQRFVDDMAAGKLANLVDEAYGPAPYAAQTDKLVEVEWPAQGGLVAHIMPQKGAAGSFGARAATKETVFNANFCMYVRGTGTTAEMVESEGIYIAVSSDWQTGVETTRPIVPSVAKVYYGDYFSSIPEARVHPDGLVKEIELKNGTLVGFENNMTKRPRSKTPTP